MSANQSLESVKGVGPRLLQLLARLGIETVDDLIHYFPRRYNDYSKITAISAIEPGPVTLKVKVQSINQRYVRRGLHITEAMVADRTGQQKIVWFNQPYRADALKQQKWYFLSGEYQYQGRRYGIVNPAMELVSAFPKNTARIVPIYGETKGLKSHQIRKLLGELTEDIKAIPESLPAKTVKRQHLMKRSDALLNIHWPQDTEALDEARRRLAFEELFELILAAQLNKRAVENLAGSPMKFSPTRMQEFVGRLKFELTPAQKRAAWDILRDLEQHKPMNRLLEGDVGSGKSVVAAMAVLQAVDNGFQAAYMAPTEILARQQYEEMTKLLNPFKVTTSLFIGAMSGQEKSVTGDSISSGKAGLIVGTHALIQKHPKFHKLGLVIIDEQHRFGVNQREKLMGKAAGVPHVLTLTATPIPRSLALTVFGELDISIIDELPPGRREVDTQLIPPGDRMKLYKKVDKQIAEGRQAYVVCPLIDESDVLGVKSVKAEYDKLRLGAFKHRKIGLLHGKLNAEDKAEVMDNFKKGKIDILVSTTVVEVGVNVPNATVMIIEGAERFGLAQLHQLRGRIKRSSHQAYAYLIPTTADVPTDRLRVMTTTDDGFKLAELDLKLRGPGEIYGRRQHGQLDLRLASFDDVKLIAAARTEAQKAVEDNLNLLQYPRLSARVEHFRKITNLN